MESDAGSRKVDVFIPSYIECDKDVTVKEIERSCQRKKKENFLEINKFLILLLSKKNL